MNKKKHISKKRKEFVVAVIVSFFLLLFFSFVTKHIGDSYVLKDRIKVALSLYYLSKLTNPFDPTLDQRINATAFIAQERDAHSEETDEDYKNLAENTPTFTNVLGVSIQVPVVMLHYIRFNPNPNDRVGFNLSVTPPDFAAQMDYLLQHGYHTISLDEFGAALMHGTSLPPKPIVLTFDDGYADCYYQAYPALKARGMKGVNFVITNFVGAPGYLTWDQINEMKNSGVFTFGSHTLSHLALAYLYDAQVKKEVTESKNVLQAHLGYPMNWFAYPYGSVNARVAGLVQQAGYVGAFGTNAGTYQSTDYMFTLPRVRDGGGLGVAGFAQRLPW